MPNEQAEQDMRRLLLLDAVYGTDSLSAGDIQDITTLALTCPYDVGTAVDKARYLYVSALGQKFFDDASLCSGSGSGARMAGAAAAGAVDYKVYPNPSSGVIIVDYQAATGSDAMTMQIRNIFGQTVRTLLLPGGQATATADLSMLGNGVYYYQLSAGSTIKASGKLIIAK